MQIHTEIENDIHCIPGCKTPNSKPTPNFVSDTKNFPANDKGCSKLSVRTSLATPARVPLSGLQRFDA